MRRWAIAGAVALVAGFVVVSVVNLITRDTGSNPAVNSGPGLLGGAPVTSSSPAAWMGVRTQTWPGGGALIEGVDPGSPAAVSGLESGDVIIGIDNAPVNSAGDVRAALQRLRPGQTVAVQADRGSAGFTAQVTLGSEPTGRSGP
jgi:S1-C subfamily serine protease